MMRGNGCIWKRRAKVLDESVQVMVLGAEEDGAATAFLNAARFCIIENTMYIVYNKSSEKKEKHAISGLAAER